MDSSVTAAGGSNCSAWQLALKLSPLEELLDEVLDEALEELLEELLSTKGGRLESWQAVMIKIKQMMANNLRVIIFLLTAYGFIVVNPLLTMHALLYVRKCT